MLHKNSNPLNQSNLWEMLQRALSDISSDYLNKLTAKRTKVCKWSKLKILWQKVKTDFHCDVNYCHKKHETKKEKLYYIVNLRSNYPLIVTIQLSHHFISALKLIWCLTSETPIYILVSAENHKAASLLNPAACFHSAQGFSCGRGWTSELRLEQHSQSLTNGSQTTWTKNKWCRWKSIYNLMFFGLVCVAQYEAFSVSTIQPL